MSTRSFPSIRDPFRSIQKQGGLSVIVVFLVDGCSEICANEDDPRDKRLGISYPKTGGHQ